MATYKNGVGYSEWMHIGGWSESVIEYTRMLKSTEGERVKLGRGETQPCGASPSVFSAESTHQSCVVVANINVVLVL